MVTANWVEVRRKNRKADIPPVTVTDDGCGQHLGPSCHGLLSGPAGRAEATAEGGGCHLRLREADPAPRWLAGVRTSIGGEGTPKIDSCLFEDLRGNLMPPGKPCHLPCDRAISRHGEDAAGILTSLPSIEGVDQIENQTMVRSLMSWILSRQEHRPRGVDTGCRRTGMPRHGASTPAVATGSGQAQSGMSCGAFRSGSYPRGVAIRRVVPDLSEEADRSRRLRRIRPPRLVAAPSKEAFP